MASSPSNQNHLKHQHSPEASELKAVVDWFKTEKEPTRHRHTVDHRGYNNTKVAKRNMFTVKLFIKKEEETAREKHAEQHASNPRIQHARTEKKNI